MNCCYLVQWTITCCSLGGFVLDPSLAGWYCINKGFEQCPFYLNVSVLERAHLDSNAKRVERRTFN
jgi:hypothetical protein